MKQITGLVFIFFLSIAAHAQTIKTEAGRRMSAIEIETTTVQSRIDKITNLIKKLGIEFTSESPEIIEAKEVLAEWQKLLLKLESEKKSLATKEFIKRLPNTNVELLKVIALQNERIIDLLEQIVRRPQ